MIEAFVFAWKRAWFVATYWWFGPFGAFVAALTIALSGIVPATFSSFVPEGIIRSTFEGVIFSIVAFFVIFLACLAVYPIHAAYDAQGGFRAALRNRLGEFMEPFLIIGAGLSVFALSTVVGFGWLTAKMLKGTTPFQVVSSTPNTVGMADFYILPPEGRYRFKWNPIENTRFDVKSDDLKNPDFTSNPALILRNKTNTVAYNVKVSWRVEIAANVPDLIKSPRLSKYQFIVEPTKLVILTPPGGKTTGHQYYLDDNPKQIVQVIAKETELYLPPDLFAIAALYFVNKMPDKIGESTDPFIMRATLNWETSDGKRQRDFRIRMTATNTKADQSGTAEVESVLNFNVDEIAG